MVEGAGFEQEGDMKPAIHAYFYCPYPSVPIFSFLPLVV